MKNRLRVLRAEFHWSQLELAMRLGVSRQAINAIETGKYDPSLPLAMKIARLFERRIEDIFELDAPERSGAQGPPRATAPGGVQGSPPIKKEDGD